jgi:hypothetical protein
MVTHLLVRGRRGPAWIVTLVVAAVSVALVPAASIAAGPEKEYSTSGTLLCEGGHFEEFEGFSFVNQQVGFTLKATGPTSVLPGQQIEFHGATFTLTLPTGVVEEIIAHADGGKQIAGKAVQLFAEASSEHELGYDLRNVATVPEYPLGIPFDATLTPGQPLTLASPAVVAGENGRTYSFAVPGVGKNGEITRLRVELNPPPGLAPDFIPPQEGKTTGVGFGDILHIPAGASNPRIGPIDLMCAVPEVPTFAEIPVAGTQAAPVPTVTKVEQDHGPASGGSSVRISGTNFSAASAVDFGSTPASSFKIESENQITAVAPAMSGENAIAEVTVTTSGGTSAFNTGDSFFYEPTVTSIEPASGPSVGGTAVTITGAGFKGQFSNGGGEAHVSSVSFGGEVSSSVKVESATKITAVAPPGTGAANVTVKNLGGTSATSAADQFTYIPSARPEKEYSTSGTMLCEGGHFEEFEGFSFINQPVGFTLKAMGPTSVVPGEEIEFRGATFTLKLPTEVVENIIAHADGGKQIKGKAVQLYAEGQESGPEFGYDFHNIATVPEYPLGIPFDATLTAGQPLTLVAPAVVAGESGRTYSFSVPGVGKNGEIFSLRVELNPAPGLAPGFPPPQEGRTSGVGFGAILRIPAGTSNRPVGPIDLMCAVPEVPTFAEIPVATPPAVTNVEPDRGPASGGSSVTIAGANLEGATAVKFGSTPASSFKIESENQITAVAPAMSGGNAIAEVTVTNHAGTSQLTTSDLFFYEPEFKNWTVSGSLTPKALGQPITLPVGASFNGSGELNGETGVGSVKGSVAVPPFTNTFQLFGLLPVSFGFTIAQAAPLAGTLTKSEAVAGDELLAMPAELDLAVTSVSLLGLTIPTTCTTSEPASLSLSDTLTREEFLTKGWSFGGTATLPSFSCEGGLLSRSFAPILSALLSGPESAYSVSIRAPGS